MWFFIVACYVLLQKPALAQEISDDRYEDQVVRLLISKQVFDAAMPWKSGEIKQHWQHGVVVEGKRILTTAMAISDASFMEMIAFGEGKHWPLKLEFVDWEANLAVLSALDEKAFEGLKAVVLGDELRLDEKVDIFRAKDSQQMSRMSATLQEVGIYAALTSSYSMLSFLFKVQQTGLGWSEPIFKNSKLIGLATGQDQNYLFAIPAALIRHFFSDRLEKEHYRGFPALGVELEPLLSPDLRAYLGAQSTSKGIRIAEVFTDSPFAESLQKNDVLLEIDGVPLSQNGLYEHPKWGKVHLKYLLNQRYAGDRVQLKILRKGQEIVVGANLKRFDSNHFIIPAYRYGFPEDHLIFGGLVFQELTKNYLLQWGREWKGLAPYDLLYLYEYKNLPQENPNERIVVLNRVLADSFNRGYTELRHLVLDEVNGRKIKSLEELKSVLRDQPVMHHGQRYARFRFLHGGGEVILDYEGLSNAHARIAKTYEISTATSFFGNEGISPSPALEQ